MASNALVATLHSNGRISYTLTDENGNPMVRPGVHTFDVMLVEDGRHVVQGVVIVPSPTTNDE